MTGGGAPRGRDGEGLIGGGRLGVTGKCELLLSRGVSVALARTSGTDHGREMIPASIICIRVRSDLMFHVQAAIRETATENCGNVIWSVSKNGLLRRLAKINGDVVAVHWMIILGVKINSALFWKTPAHFPTTSCVVPFKGSFNFQVLFRNIYSL